MPPKKLKPREGNVELPEPVSKFPFRIGQDVEMKSFESGYRGAWFRVQIKRIRLDRKGNILCTMGYKDYSDESEEEINAFERDPASDERILMVRPLPPPSVKESKFNNSVHTKMCVVYRDEWEVGDLVDWWYHHCWWAAKVISVVGDGRFQLVCPAPPGGEGGVYLANSRDLRPSLKWSIAAQWTAPPSKEIGKIPCARIVWLLDSNEAAEFSSPNQDNVPQKRGRPKVMRVASPPLDRKETAAFSPLNPDREPGKSRRPRVMELSSSHVRTYNQETAEVRSPSKAMKIPQKRGRPRKVEGQEEAAKKRRKPIIIKIIHPRQDPAYEKVERMLKNSSIDETRPVADEARTFDIRRENEMRQGAKQETMMRGKLPGDEDRKWVKKASPVTEMQLEQGNTPGSEHKSPLIAKQIPEEKRVVIKQKRSVVRMLDRVRMIRENQFSNGHFDEAKRRKLEHVTRFPEPKAGEEHERKQNSKDQDGKKLQRWKSDVKDKEAGDNILKDELLMANSEARKKKKFEGNNNNNNKVTVKTMLLNHVGDVGVQHMLGLVPRDQIDLPSLDKGKDPSMDHPSGQQSDCEIQNGELQVEVRSSNFASRPVNGEVKVPEEDLSVGGAYKEDLDLNILKVLNAYEEAFTDPICVEDKISYFSHISSAKEDEDALTNDMCSMGQKSFEGSKDMSVVRAYEEAFDIRSPRRKLSLTQEPSLAPNSKLTKPLECPFSCNRGKPVRVFEVRSPRKEVSSLDTRSRTLQDRDINRAVPFGGSVTHKVVIGTEASSEGAISVGGSEESFSGRVANVSVEEATKDSASSHHGTSLIHDQESGSSLNLESPHENQARKTSNVRLTPGVGVGRKAEKSEKNELSSVRKRNPKSVINHKLSLSRKFIDQAREVSAKRRRSWRSAQRS